MANKGPEIKLDWAYVCIFRSGTGDPTIGLKYVGVLSPTRHLIAGVIASLRFLPANGDDGKLYVGFLVYQIAPEQMDLQINKSTS